MTTQFKPHPMTDIVIPVHGALSFLRQCIETVLASTRNFRFIFVDDYSDEETAKFLRDFCAQHKSSLYIRTNKQKWFTRASNIGLRLARSQKVLLLNSDCVVNTNWLQELYNVYSLYAIEHPTRKVGLVGATLSMEDPRPYIEHHKRNPSYVTGHCLLLNMDAMWDLSTRRGTPGWFFNEIDPGQIHIASDRIMCWDLNDLGWETLASFHSAVGHVGGASWGYKLETIPSELSKVD